ncbi:sugar ABC transporter ATP-binding protein [Galbitalea soli]|uniref:Sugar ABC transporter ATP-binding protein n=1 Tax=Galbitalea soli TaxID=1268042 RepID=A0A7C9TPZ2_9MICO|nr:sugar ABC transporter ATP-binding protein [Galbitalea soli]NEM90938.1 sugar ABC transporter ATP-binding protein [Galbitalea soli]NYJ29624.1 ribose transport system ATP-binding protein [Galbitalea soli]
MDTTPQPIPLLQVSALSKSFFATRAAEDVTFSVNQGEIVSLLGENGAGKSTVIKMLAGVYRPDSGEMKLSGADLDASGVRKQISIIHQNLGLIEWMTVAENIAQVLGYPRRLGFIDQRAMNRRAAEVLELVGGGIDPQARVFDLPRTERSLLAIARGLVTNPKLLVLDEPTASLPAADVERLFAVLRRLRDSGVGMIYVSHRLDEIYEISSRTVVMRNGHVVAERPVAGLSHAELVELIVGRHTQATVFDSPEEGVRLELRDVAVDGAGPVTLTLHRGEVVALCGLRGAGQEPIGRAVAGAVPIRSGSLRLDGDDFVPRNPSVAVGRGIGFATSNREAEAVAPGMSVRENLFLNPAVWGRRAFQFRTGKAERAAAAEYVRAFGVRPADPELPLDTFSGGNQQKVILARWFGVGRKVVVLEEPTMGVDVGAKADIYGLLRDAARLGTAALVVSTDMEEVSKIAHRAIVFGRGVVVAELSGADLTIANLVAAASDLQRTTDTEKSVA